MNISIRINTNLVIVIKFDFMSLKIIKNNLNHKIDVVQIQVLLIPRLDLCESIKLYIYWVFE